MPTEVHPRWFDRSYRYCSLMNLSTRVSFAGFQPTWKKDPLEYHGCSVQKGTLVGAAQEVDIETAAAAAEELPTANKHHL